MGKVSQVVYAEFERRFVKAGEELFTCEIDLWERNLRLYQIFGLSTEDLENGSDLR